MVQVKYNQLQEVKEENRNIWEDFHTVSRKTRQCISNTQKGKERRM